MRLFRLPSRRPAPVGRHSHVMAVSTVPGAAATLVAPTSTTEALVAGAEEPADAVQVRDAVPSTVTLGFADGASVALDDDDPRVRTFRAAAAALLDAPRA